MPGSHGGMNPFGPGGEFANGNRPDPFATWWFGGGRNLQERNHKEIRHANWARTNPSFPAHLDMFRDSHSAFRIGKKDPIWNNSDTVRDVCFGDNSFWTHYVSDKPCVGQLPSEEEELGMPTEREPPSLANPPRGEPARTTPGLASRLQTPGAAQQGSVSAAAAPKRSRSAPHTGLSSVSTSHRPLRDGQAKAEQPAAAPRAEQRSRMGQAGAARLVRPYNGEPTKPCWANLGAGEDGGASRPALSSRLSLSSGARSQMIQTHHLNHTTLADRGHRSTHHFRHIFGAEQALDQQRLYDAGALRRASMPYPCA